MVEYLHLLHLKIHWIPGHRYRSDPQPHIRNQVVAQYSPCRIHRFRSGKNLNNRNNKRKYKQETV